MGCILQYIFKFYHTLEVDARGISSGLPQNKLCPAASIKTSEALAGFPSGIFRKVKSE